MYDSNIILYAIVSYTIPYQLYSIKILSTLYNQDLYYQIISTRSYSIMHATEALKETIFTYYLKFAYNFCLNLN